MSRPVVHSCSPLAPRRRSRRTRARSWRKSQRRAASNSQRYEGTLEVTGARQQGQPENAGSLRAHRILRRQQIDPALHRAGRGEGRGAAGRQSSGPRLATSGCGRPAIGRDRRIALQDRSTRFFGTDFSFEDLEERDVDQFDYRLTGEEPIDGAACWRIEATPGRQVSQYTLSRVWIRKDNYVAAHTRT